jgi:hypothetical protein
MMAKITKGGSFGGCVGYVIGKTDAKLLAADGVLLESKQSVIDSFEAQSLLNPRLGRKVGHISLNFSTQDSAKITDQFMLKVAGEYMHRMGIKDTQYIVVRHNDREHPHCHIVFNRVDNDGKTISDKNDRMRSVRACREITERHGLYIASGKENVNRQQLRDPDSIKYAIYDAIKAALPNCKSWDELERKLSRDGIAVTFKYGGGTDTKQGVIFGMDGQSFNGSKIDRAFSFSKLDAVLNANAQRQERRESIVSRENMISTTQEPSRDSVATPTREIREESPTAPAPTWETSEPLNTPGFAPSFAPSPSFSPSPQPNLGQHSAPSHGHSIGGNLISGVGSAFGILTPEPGGEEDNAPMPKPKKKKKNQQQYKPRR